MTNDPILIKVAKFVRDLLGVDETLIQFGRDNWQRQGLASRLIVVDSLGANTPIASGADFDGDAEELTTTILEGRAITLDFYGSTAYTDAEAFLLLQRGETARELMASLGLTVYRATGPRDLKWLAGSQYSNRLQVEFNIQYTRSRADAVLRIDSADFTTDNFLSEA